MLSRLFPKYKSMAARWTPNMLAQYQPKFYNTSFKEELTKAFGKLEPEEIESKILDIQSKSP